MCSCFFHSPMALDIVLLFVVLFISHLFVRFRWHITSHILSVKTIISSYGEEHFLMVVAKKRFILYDKNGQNQAFSMGSFPLWRKHQQCHLIWDEVIEIDSSKGIPKWWPFCCASLLNKWTRQFCSGASPRNLASGPAKVLKRHWYIYLYIHISSRSKKKTQHLHINACIKFHLSFHASELLPIPYVSCAYEATKNEFKFNRFDFSWKWKKNIYSEENAAQRTRSQAKPTTKNMLAKMQDIVHK